MSLPTPRVIPIESAVGCMSVDVHVGPEGCKLLCSSCTAVLYVGDHASLFKCHDDLVTLAFYCALCKTTCFISGNAGRHPAKIESGNLVCGQCGETLVAQFVPDPLVSKTEYVCDKCEARNSYINKDVGPQMFFISADPSGHYDLRDTTEAFLDKDTLVCGFCSGVLFENFEMFYGRRARGGRAQFCCKKCCRVNRYNQPAK